jgi:hypothetical protein
LINNADNLYLVSVFERESDCVVRIMSRLRGEWSGLRIQAGQGIFSLLQTVQPASLSYLSSYSVGTEVKAAGASS